MSLNFKNTGARQKLTQVKNKKGYMCVNLINKGKKYNKRVHRLVAKAFILNYNNLKQVNHKDGDKTNNHIDNLEWCTNQYNTKHAYDKGLIDKANINKVMPVKKIDKDTKEVLEVYNTMSEAAEKNNTYPSNISKVCRGEKKTHKGFVWRYKDDENE
jgi:hypothetical protein